MPTDRFLLAIFWYFLLDFGFRNMNMTTSQLIGQKIKTLKVEESREPLWPVSDFWQMFQFWSLRFKQSPRLIGNYLCRNGIFPKLTDTYSPREKWVFHKFYAAHTTLYCSNFKVFFSLFTIFDPSGAIKNNFFVIEAWQMKLSS